MGKSINLNNIELLVLDVDGVLTTGEIIINEDCSESKHFCTKDGHAVRLWQRAGGRLAFLSGRYSKPTQIRAEMLKIERCLQDCHYKLPALKELLSELDIPAERTAFLGDDMPDIPPIKYVGFGGAVADAAQDVKDNADFITETSGGKGAVREFIEHILKNSGRWKKVVERYGI
jgi:3-deoxy-D-manno-octulosonate 8-phosphate phosphatase (KDO 8-P phosphatase)